MGKIAKSQLKEFDLLAEVAKQNGVALTSSYHAKGAESNWCVGLFYKGEAELNKILNELKQKGAGKLAKSIKEWGREENESWGCWVAYSKEGATPCNFY